MRAVKAPPHISQATGASASTLIPWTVEKEERGGE